MADTIVICGYGPAISDATARRFARAGFDVALVARSAEKVERAAQELSGSGVRARGFVCNLGDPAAVRALIGEVRASFGPITVLHWNAAAHGAGDLTTSDVGELRETFDVAVTGLVSAVQAALPDLRAASGRAAVLVTGGGYAFYDPAMDSMAAKFGGMGLSVAKAAQHKLVGTLHAKLQPEGIFVGAVTVMGIVKGSAYDRGRGTIDASDVAERFFSQYLERSTAYARVPTSD